MDLVSSETLSNKYASIWLSYIILKRCNQGILDKYREIEKIAIKVHSLASHLSFNETCLNNSLLPTYRNIYISKTGNETTASACAKCRTMETFKKGLHGKTKLYI